MAPQRRCQPGPNPRCGRSAQVGLDPSFGGFVVTDTDIHGFSLSRQHLAAPLPPHLAERNDLLVFGSSWQAEFLGGMTAFSLEVAGDEVRVVAPNGAAHRYERTGGNRYRAADGSELTRDADEIIERTGSKQLTFVWRMVAGQWRITAVGTPDAGMDRVTYDALGRVERLTLGDASGAYADISYATATTATATNLGSIRGMIDSISSAAHRNAAPTAVATYLYDSAGRLAVVANPNTGQQSSYAYDDQSRLTKVDSLLLGGLFTPLSRSVAR
jgi:YD repeat-containing protein